MKKATIEDIARHADVSIATVSRVLSNNRIVSPQTVNAVMRAAGELGYAPRAVRPGRKPAHRQGVNTGAIALLSVGALSPSAMYNMPCLPIYLGGIHCGLDANGMAFTLTHSSGGRHVPPILARRQVDGVILSCFDPLSPALKALLTHIPTVWGFRANGDRSHQFDHVVYDNEKVGQMAAAYLLERGCRHLFFASHESRHIAFVDRRSQFQQAVLGQGVQATLVEWTHGPHPACRINTAHELVDQIRHHPSGSRIGVFCVSDDLMLPVFHELRRHGIEPGRDVELIGCNNDPAMMMQMRPNPATIDIKLDVVGERAVDQLFWRISHRDESAPMELRIQPERVPAEMHGN